MTLLFMRIASYCMLRDTVEKIRMNPHPKILKVHKIEVARISHSSSGHITLKTIIIVIYRSVLVNKDHCSLGKNMKDFLSCRCGKPLV